MALLLRMDHLTPPQGTAGSDPPTEDLAAATGRPTRAWAWEEWEATEGMAEAMGAMEAMEATVAWAWGWAVWEWVAWAMAA